VPRPPPLPAGVVLAVPAVFWRKPAFLNLYLAWRVWVCSMAAVVAVDAIQDVYKTYNFCALKGVGGLPDADCDLRDSRARARVFYALCTALMAAAIGAVAQGVKDDNARWEMAELMRGRGGLMALRANRGDSIMSKSMMNMSRGMSVVRTASGSGPGAGAYTRSR